MRPQIHIYQFFFVVKYPYGRFIQALYQLSAEYTTFEEIFDPIRRKKKWQPSKTFGIYVGGGQQFRFHINQYDEFIRILRNKGVNEAEYETVFHAPPTTSPINLKLRNGFKLKTEHGMNQEDAKNFILEKCGEGKMPLLAMPTGSGKSCPVNINVKVPGGWKRNGDLKIGEYVTARDGTATKITGVFPQGKRPVYQITFSDNRAAYCDEDHLWTIESSTEEHFKKTVTTKEIIRLLTFPYYQGRLYIPLIDPEDCDDKEFKVNPYLLGVLIGDGHLGHTYRVTTPDAHILKRVKKLIPKTLSVKYAGRYDYRIINKIKKQRKNKLKELFKKLNLDGCRSWEKHIPEEYLHGSIKQRLALVQGLLDTDGTVDKKSGTPSYTTTSYRLANEFMYLIWSLGGIATMTSRITNYSCKGNKLKGRKSYTVFIQYRKPSDLFTLERKKKLTKDNGQYVKNLRLGISAIRYVGEMDCQCISIDHPERLYVIQNFIATHNTVTSCAAVAESGKRLAVFVLSKYVDKWVSDVHEIYDIEKKDICKIQGGDQLINATHWTKNKTTLRNNPLPKVFVVSIDTFSVWLKKYEKDPGNETLDAYGCLPWEFFETLDIGFVIFDEAHEHLHKLYRVFTFLNVANCVCCTATLISKNPTISRIQFMLFPRNLQFTEIKMRQYIEVIACAYQITNFQTSKIKTSYPGDNRYNHNAFEESILNHKLLAPQYVDMIMALIYDAFITSTSPGHDKLIVFVSSIDMGNRLAKEIKKRWPKYDTRTYFEEDPYANIIEADIRVTTIISGSTAVDVKGLTTCIMTNSIDSPISNLQALGRLREIANKKLQFFYIYCSSIEKQRDYHYNKIELFRAKVKSQINRFIGTLFSS